MKKILSLLFVVAIFTSANAQKCNAVFFNQDGQKFQVTVNGILQNLDYSTNVKVTDLNFEGNYKVAINFENTQYPSINKSIYMMENNSEYTFNIKKNKKGVYVMRANGLVPIAQAPAPAPTQTVMTYSTTPPAPAPTTVVTETVTTSTTTNVNGGNATVGTNQENVSMNVSVGGASMNVNVNVNDAGMNTDATSTTSYTETTTVTTSSSSTYTENVPTETVVVNNQHNVMPGYSGPVGCAYPMSSNDFNSAKTSISSKDFSDSKLTLAKQITKTNCLTSDQAKQIIELFDFEDTRLDYAKFAYGYTYDIGNYYKVNDAFEFESSIEELNNYIEGNR